MDYEVISDEEAKYAKLTSLEGINAIRDDFAFWQSCDYECYGAKPLWINLDDSKHQDILFDDSKYTFGCSGRLHCQYTSKEFCSKRERECGI